ncbi:hypothetical protein QC763_0007010 [Podospora pseudopauciseta]|uniref:Uncharacterized protein n=2 Tax=Podospora TaxID=5144 RepID=A0ABR0HXC2_9PEZI|nr:hypothetical protein QC763_0007010 [Podospora pseudopauciseta]KAK4681248.1 hypothetical protein QC764_0007050 [Podospora pseudoanserina]
MPHLPQTNRLSPAHHFSHFRALAFKPPPILASSRYLGSARHLLLHANTETNIEAGDITPEYQQKPNSYLAESGEDKRSHVEY